jgi:hypothetical protein
MAITLLVLTWQERERVLMSYKDTLPIVQVILIISLKPNHLPKAPTQNNATFGVRFSVYEFKTVNWVYNN